MAACKGPANDPGRMLRPQSASDLLVVQAPKAVIFAEPIPVRGLGKPDKKALRAKHAAKAG